MAEDSSRAARTGDSLFMVFFLAGWFKEIAVPDLFARLVGVRRKAIVVASTG